MDINSLARRLPVVWISRMKDDFCVLIELFHSTKTMVINTTNTAMGNINSFFGDLKNIVNLGIRKHHSFQIGTKVVGWNR